MECNIDQLSIENHFVNNKWNYNIPNKLLLTIIYLDVEFTSKAKKKKLKQTNSFSVQKL